MKSRFEMRTRRRSRARGNRTRRREYGDDAADLVQNNGRVTLPAGPFRFCLTKEQSRIVLLLGASILVGFVIGRKMAG